MFDNRWRPNFVNVIDNFCLIGPARIDLTLKGSDHDDPCHVIDLTGLSSGHWFIIQGDTNLDNAGTSVSSAGEVNGDGYDDVIVGAFRGSDGGLEAGEAYVIYGGPQYGGVLPASDGVDLLDFSGAVADRTVAGKGGNDTILTGSGNDFLNGEDGIDSLTGNAGDDTLLGGPGMTR